MKKVLFIGDSITDNGVYPAIIDTYLTLNSNLGEYQFFNVGLSSENLTGLTESSHHFPRPNILERLEKCLDTVQPDAVISLYGINDGIYLPFSEERFNAFKKGYDRLIEIITSRGTELNLCTTTFFDSKSSHSLSMGADDCENGKLYCNYNDVMTIYSNHIKSLKDKVNKILDMHTAMQAYVDNARIKNPTYKSGDGIHPSNDLAFAMANCILKEYFDITEDMIYLKDDKIFDKFFKLIFKRDILSHYYYKELIGHASPYKSKKISIGRLKKVTKSIDTKLNYRLKTDFFHAKRQSFGGFVKYKTYFNGKKVYVVEPNVFQEQKKWVWRTEFFGAFSQIDLELLKHGFYIIYLEIPNLYGCDTAVDMMDSFYHHVTKVYGLREKFSFIGMSRGGLYAINYAAKFIDKIDVLYLDAPVIDINSWPLSKKSDPIYAEDAKKVEELYSVHERGIAQIQNEMLSRLKTIADNNTLVYMVTPNNDCIVPYDENGKLLQDCYKQNSPFFNLYTKNQDEHHPHGLPNSSELAKNISDFVK